ncbi:MAG: hypothetical protein ACK4HV_03530 [Parachlamydiaceae bacterium]
MYKLYFLILIAGVQSLFGYCDECDEIFRDGCDDCKEVFDSTHYLTYDPLGSPRERMRFRGKECRQKYVNPLTLTYYLNISDFIESFIEIPTSNVSEDSSTISSTYLAGRAPLYDEKNQKVGVCSASFLCMQNSDGIYNDISNYLSVDSGLVVSWFTPTRLINLELDSIVNSMVTECIVLANTKIGVNPFY